MHKFTMFIIGAFIGFLFVFCLNLYTLNDQSKQINTLKNQLNETKRIQTPKFKKVLQLNINCSELDSIKMPNTDIFVK